MAHFIVNSVCGSVRKMFYEFKDIYYPVHNLKNSVLVKLWI